MTCVWVRRLRLGTEGRQAGPPAFGSRRRARPDPGLRAAPPRVLRAKMNSQHPVPGARGGRPRARRPGSDGGEVTALPETLAPGTAAGVGSRDTRQAARCRPRVRGRGTDTGAPAPRAPGRRWGRAEDDRKKMGSERTPQRTRL